MRQRPSRIVGIGTAFALSAVALVAATPAAGTLIWHQSVGRAGPDAPCPESSDLETAEGWTPWAPSWEQWPNSGEGGYVCSRWNVWAQSEAPSSGADDPTRPSIGCVLVLSEDNDLYIDFGGSWYVTEDSLTQYENDPTCSGTAIGSAAAVYAPPPFDPAALCEEGPGDPYLVPIAALNDVYACTQEDG